MTVDHCGLTVEWLGYATTRIEGPAGTVAYLDPGRYGVLDGYDARDGDLVCVTHVHHYDTDAIRRVAAEDATVVAYEAIHHSETDRDVTPLRDLGYETVGLNDEADTVIEDTVLRTVPAYNHPDGDHLRENGEPVHPEGFGCGYLLTMGDVTVFYPGDTDVLSGHAELDVSVFLAPIGGTFTMDRHRAADLAAGMDPDLVVPVHYDAFPAIEADAEVFAADVAGRGIPVAIDGPKQG